MGNKITTREGFISDNLVNIGKRLQINHDLQNAAEKSDPDVAIPAEKLSVRRVAVERTETDRMLRELRDRLGHESAAVGVELEQLTEHREELERFRDFLAGASSSLDEIEVDSSDAVRRIGEIRYRLFTASGRAQAFFAHRGGATGASASAQGFESKPSGTLWREALPLALAIVFSALLIGAAIIYSLH